MKAHSSLHQLNKADDPVSSSKEIGPLGPAQAMLLPAALILSHFEWTSVLLVDGTRAWFEDEKLEEHGYDPPPLPTQ